MPRTPYHEMSDYYMSLPDLPSPTARALQRLQHDMDDLDDLHEDYGGLYLNNEQSPTTVEDNHAMTTMICNQSVFVPLNDLQRATCAAGDGQTALAQTPDGETSKKLPAKKKAPAKKATAVKRTANKPAAKKPPASLAPASDVVQASLVFPKLARGGGNMTGVKSSTRKFKEFRVKINDDKVALWEPNTRNAQEITILKEAIETLPSDAKTCDGTKLHPLLHVSSVCIPMSLSNAIDNRLYGHRKQGNKAFLQLLTYLGMRSSINKMTQVRTLTFDPDGWNRMGYRLVRGGDTKGGKPEIVYVR
jgi:hypothetical protein